MPQRPKREDTERRKNKERFFNTVGNIDGWQVREGRVNRQFTNFKNMLDASGTQRSGRDGWPLFEKCRTNQEPAHGTLVHYTQKGVDVAFSVDLITLAAAGQISDAILIAGDLDFVLPVQRCQDIYSVKVTLWYHPNNSSNDLRSAADQRRIIDQSFIDKLKS